MDENGKIALAIIGIIVMFYLLSTPLLGVSAGAIGLSDFALVWEGIGTPFQTGILFIVFILIVAVIIGKKD